MRRTAVIVFLLLGLSGPLHASAHVTPDTRTPAIDRAAATIRVAIYLQQIDAQAKALQALAADAYRQGAAIRLSCLSGKLAEANATASTAHQLSDSWSRAQRNPAFGRRSLARLQELAVLTDADLTDGRACLGRKEAAISFMSSTAAIHDEAVAPLSPATAGSDERMGELRRPPLASPY